MVKCHQKKDPHRKREAKKYERPVPSREYILSYLEEVDKPVNLKQLIEAFGLKPDEEEGLRRRLRAMQRDGQLMSTRRGAYGIVNSMELLPGRIQAHRDGFGFFIPNDGSDDVFLPARQMRGVFNDDRVLVRVTGMDQRNRKEGMIVDVLERNTHHVVGRFVREGGQAFIDPDDKLITQDIIIPEGDHGKAKQGQYVVAEIVEQPSARRAPVGKIIDVLGDQLTPGMEVELAIRSHDLPCEWPEAVLTEAKQFGAGVKSTDIEGRQDLRHLPFVTIDGEDAKDFDDAVYCEKRAKGGWRLWVAIADVTHYLKPKAELDREAQHRGNSVYFPNRVIPMLPEVLSNGLCSLVPKQDRLTMVCEMTITPEADVNTYRFYEAVIHSHERFTYTKVFELLQDEKAKHPLLPDLKSFHSLYKALLKRRKKRGAIEFETLETRIVFGEQGKIDKIVPVYRNEAHRMIEEAMLLANVCTAKFLEKTKMPCLYRVHEGPEAKKLSALRDFLKAFGLRLTGGNQPQAADYARLLQRVQDRPDAHLLQTVMLRSLRQAVYTPENKGHFGLSYKAYTHFTSPIRRYPDVIVHRALKELIHKEKKKPRKMDVEKLAELADHFSKTERRADLATRDATDWLKCDYMQDKVGESFEGIVTDVTGFGVFVELKDIYVQGLVHITSLQNDYYHYDPTHHLLRGRRSGKVYRLGDLISVTVARVDLDNRRIDFELSS